MSIRQSKDKSNLGGIVGKITRDNVTKYQTQNPSLNTEVDTGVLVSSLDNTSDITITAVVTLNNGNRTYAVSKDVTSSALQNYTNIRFSETSELEGVGGDVFISIWSNGSTIMYEFDLDGGNKTVSVANLTETIYRVA